MAVRCGESLPHQPVKASALALLHHSPLSQKHKKLPHLGTSPPGLGLPSRMPAVSSQVCPAIVVRQDEDDVRPKEGIHQRKVEQLLEAELKNLSKAARLSGFG